MIPPQTGWSPCRLCLLCVLYVGTLAGCGDSSAQVVAAPASRASTKSDLRALEEPELDRLRAELMDFKLATFRYKTEAVGARPHLGFLIDDVEPSAAVAADGEHVDLLGYTGMVVATLQLQERRIAALRTQVDELRELLRARRRR